MNGKIRYKKVLAMVLFLFTAVSFSSELNLVLKVKNSNIKMGDSLAIAKTGIQKWDILSKQYCCTEIKKLHSLSNIDRLAEKIGLNSIYTVTLSCVDIDTADVIQIFMQSEMFEYVEVDQILKPTSVLENEPIIPNDPYLICQWPLHNTGIDFFDTIKVDADVDMPEAWGIEQGDSSVIIAILDSGIKNWHNEFDGRIWINKNEIPGNGIDDDNNSLVDDTSGWNFAYGNNNINDDRGHGTAVASIIGSNTGNNQGMAGVNGKSKLMILKVSDINGNCYTSSITSAIKYAVDYGAKIINLSLASPNFSNIFNEMIQYAYQKNVSICAGSGNANVEMVYYPAKYSNVIAVGATDRNDKRCTQWINDSVIEGSNYGDSLDVVAPGDSISAMYYFNGSYTRRLGTSFSTAFVTGLASLLISQDTSRTPDEIYKLITSTADDQVGDPSEDTPGYDKYYGYGRINAYKALLAGQATLINKKNKQSCCSMPLANVLFVKNSNLLHVKLVNDEHESTAAFKLLTPHGRVVYSVNKAVSSNEFTISLPRLSRGIYCYSIDLNGNKYSGKLLF